MDRCADGPIDKTERKNKNKDGGNAQKRGLGRK